MHRQSSIRNSGISDAPFDLEDRKASLSGIDGEDYSDVTERLSSEKDERRSDCSCDHFRQHRPSWDLQRIREKKPEASLWMWESQRRQRLHWHPELRQTAGSRYMVFTVPLYSGLMIRLSQDLCINNNPATIVDICGICLWNE